MKYDSTYGRDETTEFARNHSLNTTDSFYVKGGVKLLQLSSEKLMR